MRVGRCLLLLVFGCEHGQGGGGVFVDANGLDTQRLSELTSPERDQVCDASIVFLGPPNEAQCSSDTFVDVGSQTHEICLSQFEQLSADCPVTVGEFLTCSRDITMMTDEQICRGPLPPSCVALQQCFTVR